MGLFAPELLVPLVLYVARLCYKLDVMTLHFETLWDAMRQYETTAVLHTGIYWEYFDVSLLYKSLLGKFKTKGPSDAWLLDALERWNGRIPKVLDFTAA